MNRNGCPVRDEFGNPVKARWSLPPLTLNPLVEGLLLGLFLMGVAWVVNAAADWLFRR